MLTLPFPRHTGLDFDNSYKSVLLRPFHFHSTVAVTATGSNTSEKGIKQAQHFSKQAGSPNYTRSLWCSYNLDIMCYKPESDIPACLLRDSTQQHKRGTEVSEDAL